MGGLYRRVGFVGTRKREVGRFRGFGGLGGF